nr:unnamed protein product [Digitaria exilis]
MGRKPGGGPRGRREAAWAPNDRRGRRREAAQVVDGAEEAVRLGSVEEHRLLLFFFLDPSWVDSSSAAPAPLLLPRTEAAGLDPAWCSLVAAAASSSWKRSSAGEAELLLFRLQLSVGSELE